MRRSARVPLPVPIIISGKDDLGRTFKENTRTVEVSKNGAKILTVHRLALHADIAVANPAVGRTCLAKVTWRGPRRSSEAIEIGIELLESYQPERIWGLESPPDDWLRGGSTPTADQRLQYLCARDRTRSVGFETEVLPEVPEALPAPVPAPGTPAIPPRTSPGRGPQPHDVGGPSHLSAAQVAEQLEAVTQSIGPKLEQSVAESAAQITDRLAKQLEEQALTVSRQAEEAVQSLHLAAQEALARLETIDVDFTSRAEDYEKRLTDAAASGMEELRQTSKTLTDDLHGRLATVSQGFEQKEITELAERIQQITAECEERSSRNLEQLAASTSEKLGADLKTSGAEIVNEARNELFRVTQSLVGSVTQEAASAVEECHQELAEAFEEHIQKVTSSGREAVDSVGLTKEETLNELRATRQEAEASLENRATEYRQRLAELTASGVGELEHKSDALLKGFQGQLQNTLESLQEQGTKEVADRLQKIAAELQGHSAEYLEQQAAATVERLSQELRTSGTTVVGETEQRLANLTEASIEALVERTRGTAEEYRNRLLATFEQQAQTVAGDTQTAVESVRSAEKETIVRLEQLQQQMEAGLETASAQCEKRIADLATSGSTELERKSDALLEGFQGQLQNTLESFQERGTKEVADRLQKIAAELQGRSAEYLEQQAAATVERLGQELTASGIGIAEEARKQLVSLTQGSLESLTQEAETISARAHEAVGSVRGAADQSVAKLEATQQRMAASFELDAREDAKRIAALAASGMEGLEQKSELLSEALGKQGADLARSIQEQAQAALESTAVAGSSVARASEEAVTKLQATRLQMEGDLETVAQVHRQRLAGLATSGVESIQRKSDEFLEEFAQHRAELVQTFDEQTRAISGRADAAAGSLGLAAEQAVARLQTSRQEIESGLETRTQDHQQRIEQLLASRIGELEQRSTALAQGLEGRVEKTFEELQQKRAQEVASQLRIMAAELEQHAASQIEQRTTATLQKLNEQLMASGTTMMDEAKKQLASVTQKSLDSVTWATAKECRSQLERIFREQSETVSGAANEAVKSVQLAAEQTLAKLQTVEQKLEVSFESSAAHHQKQLAEVAAAGSEALQRTSSDLLQGFQGQLKNSLRAFEEKSGKELEGMLERITANARELSAQELRKHAAETERKLREGLTASGASVVEEARRLAGITHQALDTLSQTAAEDCRKRIDEFKRKTDGLRDHAEQTTGAKLEKLERDLTPAAPKASRPTLFVTGAIFLFVVAPVLTAIYLSTRPVMRLRTEPPPEFAEVNPNWNAKRRAAEQQLARAYWDMAAENVQAMYRYGMNLPDDPPAAFKVDTGVFSGAGLKVDVSRSQERYWQKLREVWGKPDAWEQAEGWHTDWVDSLSTYLQHAVVNLRWKLGSRFEKTS